MPPGLGCWRSLARHPLLDRVPFFPPRPMASEIFGTAALFWVLIPVGLVGGGLLLRLLRD